MDKVAFSTFIKERRLQKGISLRRFAEMADISATYLSRIERGDFNPPSEDAIKRISLLLHTDADNLLVLAGKVPTDVVNILLQHPEFLQDIRAKHISKETDE